MDPVEPMQFQAMKRRKSGIGGLLSSAFGFIPGQLLGKAADSAAPQLTNPYAKPGFLGKAVGFAGGIQDAAYRQGLPAGAAKFGMSQIGGLFNKAPVDPFSDSINQTASIGSSYLQQPEFGAMLKKKNKYGFFGG